MTQLEMASYFITEFLPGRAAVASLEPKPDRSLTLHLEDGTSVTVHGLFAYKIMNATPAERKAKTITPREQYDQRLTPKAPAKITITFEPDPPERPIITGREIMDGAERNGGNSYFQGHKADRPHPHMPATGTEGFCELCGGAQEAELHRQFNITPSASPSHISSRTPPGDPA